MSEVKREYSGAALNTFVLGLNESQSVIDKILADLGLSEIDPEAWYDFDLAGRVFRTAQEVLGKGAVLECGRTMVESAEYPPEINSIETLLTGLQPWYLYHARGPNIGEIKVELEDEHSATIDWSTVGFPCSFCVGILEGAATRYGVRPLIEHGTGTCRDKGDANCVYYVSW